MALALLLQPAIIADLSSLAGHRPSPDESPLDSLAIDLSFVVWFLSVFALRFHWLKSARRGRKEATDEPPSVAVAGGAYIEKRPLSEAAAWPLALAPLVWLVFPLAGAIAFYRLVLTDDRLRRAAAAPQDEPRRGHPCLTALAFASVLLTPLVVCFRLWRIAGPAGRQHRLLAAASCPVLVVFTWVLAWSDSVAVSYGCWMGAAVLYACLLVAYQRRQNDLVRSLGVPVAYGRCEQEAGSRAYARKGRRVRKNSDGDVENP
ncbi:hypothetical protein [Streptomyces sp. NPDC049555]|uniref:hypothetical protein n=1 Tax=unclassified Streptomyces TaxID=2593676 RepID=UPI0034471D8F